MGCRSDYLECDAQERELSRVYWVMDDLDSKCHQEVYGTGYDNRAYNKGRDQKAADALVSALCARLKEIDDAGRIEDYALETQMWWRDHKLADAKREVEEAESERLATARQTALKKLTAEEIALLDIHWK